MKDKSLYLLGAGGHAKVVLSTLLSLGYMCSGIYDDNQDLWGKDIWGVPILGAVKELNDSVINTALVSVGDNQIRRRIVGTFKNISWMSIVHPSACVHSSVKIGVGCVVFAGAVIQPDTIIGNHSIINTSASVDHDCSIGDYVHVAPGCHLAGGVAIGDGVFMGISSSVIPYKKITSNVVVGAGACVVHDIAKQGVYVGVPAKPVDKQ